ncbi:MAG: 5-(carboxyamino)imidazole ribonucleotide mutase [Spirochaetales bacterium]|jgi:5-(carboxyamino)imidazole ribonucleotide mutase|nr:5-(carboxyamino)imidazole ribonucleotide mutase [Spirochaetales bacterium]
MKKPLVGIIMGSDSDLPVMKDAAEILGEAGVCYELTIVSAHRTPRRLVRYAETAARRGLKLIIAGAGGAAHLPGMTAALTTLPVIGVPVKTQAFSGLDSMLSIVQMPGGIPVATVAVNGAKNAGLLALRVLALSSRPLARWLDGYMKTLETEVEKKAQRLEKDGFTGYKS